MSTATNSNTEKITFNVNMSELGQIDYLVEKGIYTNRSDFIRMAIRKQLEPHAADVGRFIDAGQPGEAGRSPKKGTRFMTSLGICRLTRAYVDDLIASGHHVTIRVIGALVVDKRVTPQQIRATVESCMVYGKIVANEEVRMILNDVRG